MGIYQIPFKRGRKLVNVEIDGEKSKRKLGKEQEKAGKIAGESWEKSRRKLGNMENNYREHERATEYRTRREH